MALSFHMVLDVAMPGHEWALVAVPKGPLSQQEKPFSHRGRSVTINERDVVRE